MTATPLPSTGGPPPEPARCDASGMAEIHRMFRAGFAEAPALVAAVRPGDTAHAAAVAAHVAALSRSLHVHHEGEDSMVWGRLEQRAPACAVHVDRMRAQHAAMLEHLDALDRALPAWREHGGDAGPVQAALGGVNAALAEHLPDEEATIVPVMESVMTQREVDALGEHGRRSTPRGLMWAQLGAILAAQPDGGGAWLRTHLPPPVRVIWRVVGRRRYARYRATLIR